MDLVWFTLLLLGAAVVIGGLYVLLLIQRRARDAQQVLEAARTTPTRGTYRRGQVMRG